MDQKIKVINNLYEDALATEIQEQEDNGWQLVTSFRWQALSLGKESPTPSSSFIDGSKF
jgi:hypothetical protein